MLIHLVTDHFNVGGGLEHIYQIARGMKDIHFGIFARPGPAVQKFLGLENAAAYDLGYEPGYVLENNPDLVHIHHLRPLCSFFKKPFTRYRIPIIFTAHGLHIHKYEFSASLTNKIKYFLRFHLEKRIFKRASRIIAVSREDQGFLEHRYRLGSVEYLTNGIDFTGIDRITATKEVLRSELQLPTDHLLFITVARFDFQKGHDILIKAISLIKNELQQKHIKKVKFIFVGHGPEFEKMKRLTQGLSVDQFITFLGEHQDVYQVHNMVKASDLFILPSRWEGLPIVLLETGRLKIPVLASDTYGNREILAPNRGRGILFKNGDPQDLAAKIIGIINGKYDLLQCSQNLYQEVSANYNLPKMLFSLKNLYHSLET